MDITVLSTKPVATAAVTGKSQNSQRTRCGNCQKDPPATYKVLGNSFRLLIFYKIPLPLGYLFKIYCLKWIFFTLISWWNRYMIFLWVGFTIGQHVITDDLPWVLKHIMYIRYVVWCLLFTLKTFFWFTGKRLAKTKWSIPWNLSYQAEAIS